MDMTVNPRQQIWSLCLISNQPPVSEEKCSSQNWCSRSRQPVSIPPWDRTILHSALGSPWKSVGPTYTVTCRPLICHQTWLRSLVTLSYMSHLTMMTEKDVVNTHRCIRICQTGEQGQQDVKTLKKFKRSLIVSHLSFSGSLAG